METPDLCRLRHGSPQPLPARVPLRAGPLELFFEHGDLRYVRAGGREAVRRVYVGVRAADWATVPPEIERLEIEERAGGFRVSFLAIHRNGAIDFAWEGTIEGDERGTIEYRMEGEARSTFLRNRIGVCLLHPASCAGARCRVERTDGTAAEGRFPEAIAPHQPFTGIRAFSHEVAPGLRLRAEYSGDVFEMEDQRNWTDWSFKTYSTPLDLPIPVEVRRGTKIAQTVRLNLEGTPPAALPSAPVPILRVGSGAGAPLPELGLGLASHGRPLAPAELERLRPLGLSHLRADLELSDPACGHALARACADAAALGAALEPALFLSDDAEAELDRLRGLLEPPHPPVKRFLVFRRGERSTRAEPVALARRILAPCVPEALFGGGSDGYFVEINRVRPPDAGLDFVCFSANPQVHAYDCATMAENLAGLGAASENARAFCRGVPLAVTPITLRPRFRSKPGLSEPGAGSLPFQVDPRQASLFGAAWSAGCLAALAAAGVESATFFETTGWRGVMETAEGSPPGLGFDSIPGSVFPLYHVFADAAGFRGGRVLPAVSSDPPALGGLAFSGGGSLCVLAASYRPEPQRVRIEGLAPRLAVRRLNEANAREAMCEPEKYRAAQRAEAAAPAGVLELELQPFELVRLDALP